MKRTLTGPLLALLLLSLTACASTYPATSYSPVPPAHLLSDCDLPVASVGTNGELATSLKAAYRALYDCTDDKRALRIYYLNLQGDSDG